MRSYKYEKSLQVRGMPGSTSRTFPVWEMQRLFRANMNKTLRWVAISKFNYRKNIKPDYKEDHYTNDIIVDVFLLITSTDRFKSSCQSWKGS